MSNPNESPDSPSEPQPSSQTEAVPYGEIPPNIIETDKDSRTWGMLCHLSTLCVFVGIPGFVGPLVIWLMKKDEMPFVDDQGKESLNFQICLAIAYFGAIVLGVLLCIGFVVLPVIGLVHLIFAILATVKANEGVYYRYPLNLRLVT